MFKLLSANQSVFPINYSLHMKQTIAYLLISFLLIACRKENGTTPKPTPTPTAKTPYVAGSTLNSIEFNATIKGTNLQPQIKISFTQPLKTTTASAVMLKDNAGNTVSISTTFSNGDSAINIAPTAALSHLTQYNLTISSSLQSLSGGAFSAGYTGSFVTSLDPSRKFPAITDAELLTKVQQQTFKYFWDFAHPVSGLAREGSKHPANIATIGGSGFGIMALLVGIERGFITKAQGLQRLQTIVGFLKNTAQTFHGAFPHWLDGATGVIIPFSANDNGADMVETSFLIQGLFTARQYFSATDAAEATLRADINTIINRVEWNWFQQNNQSVLYWHWSPDKAWVMNHKIQGWNEALITYVLAASSTNYSITKTTYDAGWARTGAIANGGNFYGYTLPLGENFGGPLFFEHYSFLGINPNGLTDPYANYQTQTKNHTLINYNYCKANPRAYYGYSDSVWGLTASNIKGGYTASSPTNDQSFIAPTAALSSMPYTPNESMAALKYFYYVLGDKIFKEYGFVDAFSLDVVKNNGAWYDDAFLAIDQGPIIVMIENHRSQLLWNLFMSAPEVRAGLTKLGFTGF